MYWIYLTFFVLIVLTPKVIQEGVLLFREEDIESLVIFCFGVLGFALYLAKEKALLKTFQEKLHLQKRTNIITKDLSDSYSYIGEMNRKFDIVKELIFRLPEDAADTLQKKRSESFLSILEAAKVFAKSERVSLRFVNVKTKSIEKILESGPGRTFDRFDAATLLSSKKTFWEEENFAIVRSPLQARGIVAYIIFQRTTNHIEDADVFKILASQALLLFPLNHPDVGEEQSVSIKKK